MDSNQKPGISAILIVYNEEKIIERCLKSLTNVVDEIIVIHDGECQDQTLSIAGKYTDKIYIEPHMGIAELHQTKALDYTSFSWILRIDADEYLSEELRSNLRSLVRDERYDMYAFIWPFWDGATYLSKGLPYKKALFRKEKIFAVDFPTKTYSINGMNKNVPLLLEHRPKYNNFAWETFQKKWMVWMKIQATWTFRHKDVHFYNCTQEQINGFHRSMEKQIRYANPILTPAWFFLSFGKFCLRLKIWQNLKLIKPAFLQGYYAAWLCYAIWQAKR